MLLILNDLKNSSSLFPTVTINKNDFECQTGNVYEAIFINWPKELFQITNSEK